jgi:SAM-dependent methyltransferase
MTPRPSWRNSPDGGSGATPCAACESLAEPPTRCESPKSKGGLKERRRTRDGVENMADPRVASEPEHEREVWNRRARADAFGAILSGKGPTSRKWTNAEFFESGEQEVRIVLAYLTELGVYFQRRDALEFGCGLGRLSRALSHYFGTVLGVDVSDVMIGRAKELNSSASNLRFILNVADDLSGITGDSFDFILSDIVLQHIPPELSKGYLTELMRLLRPGGIMVFQLPGAATRHGLLSREVLHRGGATSGLHPSEVRKIIEKGGGTIRDTRSSNLSYASLTHILPGGPAHAVPSLTGRILMHLTDRRPSLAYVVSKPDLNAT